MSLTAHLDDPKSRLRRFMDRHFPNLPSFYKVCNAPLRRAWTVRPAERDRYPWSTIGMAFDYRLRYYFEATPSKKLVAHRGASGLPAKLVRDFFTSLDRDVLPTINPVRRRLQGVHEELINRYCVVLALFEELYRNPTIESSPLLVPKPKKLADLLAIARPRWLDDLRGMSWAFYDHFAGLLYCDPVILNPTFDGSKDVGGADADLIVGGCLIDVKSTVLNKGPEWSRWVRQLLGYVLLDYTDRYHIEEVGLYLARQRVLVRWPLPELLFKLTGHKAPPLKPLRRAFKAAVTRRRI